MSLAGTLIPSLRDTSTSRHKTVCYSCENYRTHVRVSNNDSNYPVIIRIAKDSKLPLEVARRYISSFQLVNTLSTTPIKG